jgi:hypothetical protein
MPVPDPAPTVIPSARSLGSLCDLAQLADCSHCSATSHQPCDGVGGVHLARFARAARNGLIHNPEVSLVLSLAGDTFTSGTVIGGSGPEISPYVNRPRVQQQVRTHQEEAAQ